MLVVPLLLGALALGATGPRRARRAAFLGLVAGSATFLPMITWLIAPAGYLGWLSLAATQTVWIAVVAVLLVRWVRSPWLVAIAPVVWVGVEIWRGAFPLSGFAWGTLGYAHAGGSWLLPLARIGGASLVSLAAVTIGVAAATALVATHQRRWRSAAAHAVIAVVAAVLPFAAPSAPPTTGRTVDTLAVQANDIPDFTGGSVEEDVAIAQRLVESTRAAVEADGRPDLTVWPESAIDRDPFGGAGEFLRPYLEAGADAVGGQLLLGANLDGPSPATTFLNTANLVDADGQVLDRYVKRRYVPFGEYVPLRPLLTALIPPLRQVPRDGVAGPRPQTVDAIATGLAVIICYETLYADVVRENVLAGDAGMVVAITNDASFGRSAETDQHLAQSQLRAVETGRWVVHAALSGASAFIDPDGRVHQRTPLFERATIRLDVPEVTADTPFLEVGDVVGHATRWLTFLAAAVSVVGWWRARTRRDAPEEPG